MSDDPTLRMSGPADAVAGCLGVPVFTTDLFIPAYRAGRCGEWEIRIAGMVLVPGSWSDARLTAGMAALTRDGRSRMPMTPMELESQEVGARLRA